MESRPTSPIAARPSVLRLAGPLVVSFWMRSLFTFVDTIYAATLGDDAVAAIGLSIPFEFAMIAVWVGLSTGLTSVLSRAMGARQDARIAQVLAASRALVLGCVPLFVVLGTAAVLLADRIAPTPEVARPFAIYGGVLLVGSAFSMFWSVIPDSIVKAHHDTKATMWAGIWSNLINVALNTLFTFVFHWGIFGIAFSTVLGRFGGLAYALRKAAAHEAARKASWTDPVPGLEPHPYRAILALAVPSALAYTLMAIESAVVNGLLGGLGHATEALAAYAIQYRVLMFAVTPAIAAAVAMLPYTARRFGEGDLLGIRRGLREAHAAGAVYAVALLPVMWAAARPLAAWLTDAPLAEEFATFALRTVPFATLAALPFFLIRPAFEGMGRGQPGLVAAAIRYLLLTAPLVWAGREIAERAGYAGFAGVILGLLAASAVSSLLFLAWIGRALGKVESGGEVRAYSP